METVNVDTVFYRGKSVVSVDKAYKRWHLPMIWSSVMKLDP